MGTFAFRLFYFKYMVYSKLASAIFNDIQAGLRGYSANLSLSLDQLEDDVIDERLQIIKEYALKGILPKKDLMLSINCIPVDCESLDRCCVQSEDDELVAHFEIPQVIADFGTDAIEYIGATDRQLPFIWYNSAISGGEAFMKWADCPDKLCIHQGKISHTGETIACLPNRVTVRVISGAASNVDSIAG